MPSSTIFAICFAILSLVLISACLVLVRWTLTESRRSVLRSQEATVATTSAISAVTQVALEQMTEMQGKMQGALVAQTKDSTSSLLTLNQTSQRQNEALVALVAAKEPMAYSQLRQTDVAIGATSTDEPYAAIDDAAYAKAAEAAIAEEAGLRDILAQSGIKVTEYGD